jgi:hypothetical protein
MSDDEESEPTQSHLYRMFEIAGVVPGSVLFECRRPDHDTMQRTPMNHDRYCIFATTARDAIDLFFVQNPGFAGDVELCIYSTKREIYVFDLDLLQYSNVYSDDYLSLYIGAVNKKQRRSHLEAIYDSLEFNSHAILHTVNPFMLLAQAAGFDEWPISYCIDDVAEFYPVTAGIHFAFPDTLFGSRYLYLIRARAHLERHACMKIGAAQYAALSSGRRYGWKQKPCALFRVEDEKTCTLLALFEKAPTAYNSLGDTGWKQLADLRTALLEYAYAQSYRHLPATNPQTSAQIQADAVLSNMCAPFIPT